MMRFWCGRTNQKDTGTSVAESCSFVQWKGVKVGLAHPEGPEARRRWWGMGLWGGGQAAVCSDVRGNLRWRSPSHDGPPQPNDSLVLETDGRRGEGHRAAWLDAEGTDEAGLFKQVGQSQSKAPRS